MLSRNQLKYYASLKQKKFRMQYESFLAEGDKMVKEFIKDPGLFEPKTLLALPSFIAQLNSSSLNIKIIEITEKELSRISSLSTPNQAIMEIRIPDYEWSEDEIYNNYSLYFENIQDPGNMGTIIRTADWFGIRNIFCSPGSVDIYNPKVIQATMGSISRVKVHYTEHHIFLEPDAGIKRNFQTLATGLVGENIYDLELKDSGIIFFGNESSGLSDEIVDKCDGTISIPGHRDIRGAESLNLSIATGIICSEMLRKGLIRNGS